MPLPRSLAPAQPHLHRTVTDLPLALAISQAARPECLVDSSSDLPFFYVFSLCKVLAPLVLILSVGAARILLVFRWRFSRRALTTQANAPLLASGAMGIRAPCADAMPAARHRTPLLRVRWLRSFM